MGGCFGKKSESKSKDAENYKPGVIALREYTNPDVLKAEMALGPFQHPEQSADKKLKFINYKLLEDGSHFCGQLNEKNFIEGFGTVVYKTGEKFQGYFLYGSRNGKGRQIWPDGSSYCGDYVNGAREGFGTYIWANGDRYEGQWENNVKSGKGVYIPANGTRIEGEWKNDFPN